jgi:hypothetical protein
VRVHANAFLLSRNCLPLVLRYLRSLLGFLSGFVGSPNRRQAHVFLAYASPQQSAQNATSSAPISCHTLRAIRRAFLSSMPSGNWLKRFVPL